MFKGTKKDISVWVINFVANKRMKSTPLLSNLFYRFVFFISISFLYSSYPSIVVNPINAFFLQKKCCCCFFVVHCGISTYRKIVLLMEWYWEFIRHPDIEKKVTCRRGIPMDYIRIQYTFSFFILMMSNNKYRNIKYCISISHSHTSVITSCWWVVEGHYL